MGQGFFSNITSFRQPSTPSWEADLSSETSTQEVEGNLEGLQHSANSNKGQQASAQELALQSAATRHLRQRIFAVQILVAQFSTNTSTQEALQSILQEALLRTHAGKFQNFDAALAYLQNNLSPEAAALFQVFSSSEAGRRTLSFIRQSEGQMNFSSLRILVEAARALMPPSRYLGRILTLGAALSLRAERGNLPSAATGSPRRSSPRDDIHFQKELLTLGRDFLCETQSALSVWDNRSNMYALIACPIVWIHFFSQTPEEVKLQAQAEQAEALMQIVNASSPQMAEQAMQGDLGREVGLREIENALGRASIFFASSPGDQISMMSNYAASVASGYLSAVLSRTRFSGYALALAAVAGGVNGAVQGGIGLAHQMGNMTSQQIRRNALPLAWQFFKGIFIGVASGVGEYRVGRILHSLPISNPLLKMGVGVLGFGTGDVGAEVLATNALTWVGVSLGLEQEHILEAGGVCGFIANAVDELGGGVTNHFNVMNLMNVGALGAQMIPPAPLIKGGVSMRGSVGHGERVEPFLASTKSLAITRDDTMNSLSFVRRGQGEVESNSASILSQAASKIISSLKRFSFIPSPILAATALVAGLNFMPSEAQAASSTPPPTHNAPAPTAPEQEPVEFAELGDELEKKKREGESVDLGEDFSSAYNPKRGAENSVAILEAILLQIVQVQFAGNPNEANANVIKKQSYCWRDLNTAVEGATLLNRYAQAKWKEAHPGQKDIGKDRIFKEAGYSAAEVLDDFLKRNFAEQLKGKEGLFLGEDFSVDYNPKRGAETSVAVLEAILLQIVQVQFAGNPNEAHAGTIQKQSYRWPGLKKAVEGETLLNRYVQAKWKKEHQDQQDVSVAEVLKKSGYSRPEVFDDFLRRNFAEQLKSKEALFLGEAFFADYNPKQGAETSVVVLEAILLQIVQVQFAGNPSKATANAISGQSYHWPDLNTAVKGATLLTRYSYAKWKEAHPGQDRRTEMVLKEVGYSVAEVLDDFLRRNFAEQLKSKDGLFLGEAFFADYNPKAGAETSVAVLEAILLQIIQVQFAENPNKSSAGAIQKQSYHWRGLKKAVQGPTLLNRYVHAKWKQDHPDEKDIGLEKVIRLPAYGMALIFKQFLNKYFNCVSYLEMEQEKFEAYIKENNFDQLLDLFSSDPLLLREMLTLLKPEVFQHNDVEQFIQAYVGLQIAREKAAKIRREEVDNWELRKRYLAALAEALKTGVKLDLSEESFQHQLDLLIRLSRTSYQENPEKFIQQLQESIAKSEHPFLKRLQEETVKHFQADESFELVNMRTKASAYQKEGARFLTTHNLAILGDEAGMGKSYQAIAAVEKLGLKRVLWVTTASNKENIKREITGHAYVTERDIRVVISGDPKKRAEQVQALNGERYRITNYETLVALQKNDPLAYAKLTEGLDAIIVDEAQMTDNAETLRQNAIAQIQTPRKWLLTATPYQNKPEKFWTLLNYLDEKRYPDFQAFKNLYCESSRGLELLHTELRRYMLRRTKRHTLLNFRHPSEISFEEQLQNDALRLPKFERLDPKIWGHYNLSQEQSDLIAWMIADYRGWASAFNENLPLGAEPIDLNNINPLEKFETIHKVIYSPELFGITTPNPLYEKLDARVEEKIAKGEKIILWAWNTEVLDQLEKRYGPQGVVRIDGTVTGTAREKAIENFQNNSKAKILVANFVSGGVGLTLTAATTAIAVQLPLQYSLMYQMEGRHHRLIGMKNIQHAKEVVGMEYLIPQYPTEFLQSLTEDKLAKLMKAGTLVEQSFARLMGAETLYRLVMEGYGDPEKLDAYFKQGLLKNLGLTGSEKIDYTGHLKGRAKQEVEVVQALLPLWNLFSGSESAQNEVLELIDAYLHYPEQAKTLGKVFENAAKTYPKDLKIILSLFEFKNKHIREQLLKRLPQLLIELYQKGESLESVSSGLKMNRLNPANLIALMYVKAGLGSEVVVDIARKIASCTDTPWRRYIEEHYVAAMFGMMGNKELTSFMQKTASLFEIKAIKDEEIKKEINAKVHVLYRLGLMTRCGREVLAEIPLSLTLPLQGGGDLDFQQFESAFENLFYKTMGSYFAVTAEEIVAQVAANENWFGSADPILALMLGWQEYDNKEAVEKFQEAMMQVFEGKHKQWRLKNEAVEFLEDREEGEAYWEKIAENERSEISNLIIEFADTQNVQQANYANLREEVEQHLKAVEGTWVRDQIQAWRKLARKTTKSSTENSAQKLKMAEIQDLLRTEVERLGEANTAEQKMQCLQRLKPIKALLSWMNLDLTMESAQESNSRKEAIKELNQREKCYREAGYDKVADHFLELARQLDQEISSRRVFKDITIEDTDDPALFIRMGALHPELLNCFNPNANPTFTQHVVAALGSKNMRLVVVREQGKIVAVAMMKVKQTEEGEPVLFLEKGLYRKGYDFRKEMLTHLLKKASALPITTRVATQIMGKANDEDPFLIGTGAYTKNVYEEAVFGLRDANKSRHRARWVGEDLPPTPSFVRRESSNQLELTLLTKDEEKPQGFRVRSSLLGIGTSNKSIEQYITELKSAGVTCVVDVRQNPRSQYYPQFNRNNLESSLAEAGIRYVFMGDTLGNPKDAAGERSLENFEQTYRQTEAYQRGLKLLLELIRENKGKVALTCSEGKEHECHRKFILRDVEKSLFKLD